MSTSIKIFLVLLIILTIYILYAYIRTKNFIRIGNELANKAVAYEQLPEDAKIKILTIGDSSVVGTGASGPKNSIAGLLGKDYPNAEIINLGVNGSKVKELISRFKKLKGQKFDLVLVHIGGNDIVRRTDLEDFKKDLSTVFDLAKNNSENVISFHGGNVGTAGLFPFGTRWIFSYRTYQIRNIYMELAKEKGVRYLDLWRNKENDPFALDMRAYYARDLFHPSDEGYQDWYSFVKIELEKISL
jgi:lysophospholipase L1-like esterase